MPPVTVKVQPRFTVWRFALWTLVILGRFISGRPMKGKQQDNSTWLKGATRGKPGKVLTSWQKKPHAHRALIRNGVFWPIVGILYLTTVNRTVALLALIIALVPAAYLAFRKLRVTFFLPFTSTDAVSGDISQHWKLRPKWSKLLSPQPTPGHVAKRNRISTSFTADQERVIREAINADELVGGPPATNVKPIRYRRDR